MSESMFCSVRTFISNYWRTTNSGVRSWYCTMLLLCVPHEEITISDVKPNLEVV